MGRRGIFLGRRRGKAPPLRVTENVIVIGRGDEGIAPYERLLGIGVLGIITPVCTPALPDS